jgi:cobalt-zinc-cadmium efflux system protein
LLNERADGFVADIYAHAEAKWRWVELVSQRARMERKGASVTVRDSVIRCGIQIMAENHNHHNAGGMSEQRLKLSLTMTLGFVALEAAAGMQAHSLALLSDAGHNFTDAFALMLSWYALWIARKPATPGKTYGYHRVGILTALFNAMTLLVIAALIIAEAIHLFAHPEPVQSGPMIGVALVAVVLNTVIAMWLHGGSHGSLNIRSAYIHMLGDAISSAGVVAAGIAIRFTGWAYADTLVSVLIAVFIVYTSWGIVREAVNVLLEGTPRGLDMKRLVSEMQTVPGVEDVHDLHVWTIGDGMNTLSCHLRVNSSDVASAATVVREVKEMLATQYAMRHSTIETECLGCNTSEIYCQMEARIDNGCGHEH